MTRRLALLCLALGVALTACGRAGPPWGLKDISGLMPALSFSLVDANSGRTVQAPDFNGKVVLLYFGYTHCPDVCPTTLSRLHTAVQQLGSAAAEVRTLFVSVDPARDTPAVLKAYAKAFGPEVVGLRGDAAAIRALTRRYRVTYGYGKPDANGDYEVSHSSAVYVFDRHGEARLLIRPGDKATLIADDLHRLLAEG